jgi:FtsZ-interacting cell division protein ZipA
MNVYLIIVAIVGIIGFLLTIILANKKEKQAVNFDVRETTYKHRIIGNPALIAYAAFFFIALILILIVMKLQ